MKLNKDIKYIWSNGKIKKGKNYISTLNASLHYGLAAWEGIRVYNSEPLFLYRHVERLLASAAFLGMEVSHTEKDIADGIIDLLIKLYGKKAYRNREINNVYIRPIIYYSAAEENKYPYDKQVSVDIYAFPINSLHKSKRIDCIISSYRRAYPYNFMEAKVSSNYITAELAMAEAKRMGADDALLQSESGHIIEATVANLFIVKDGSILTPPADGCILPGLTREWVMALRRYNDLQITYKQFDVRERNLTRNDVYNADEVFITGTYAEIVPVNSVDGYKYKEDNRITQKIIKMFDKEIKQYE